MPRSYSGKFRPTNPAKYQGDPASLTYRSLLERRFMLFCDTHPSILRWSYEKIIVPYFCPTDKRWHKYYIDFLVRRLTKDGREMGTLVEIKPDHETKEPRKGKKSKRIYLNECLTWTKNQAKWESARRFAEMNGLEFRVITEKDLATKRT